jgi:coenzyme F420-reducing hydrogenase alpha subunit
MKQLAPTGYDSSTTRSTYQVNGRPVDVQFLFRRVGEAIECLPDLMETEIMLLGNIRGNLSPSNPRLTTGQLSALELYMDRLKKYESTGERVVPTDGSRYNDKIKQIVYALVCGKLTSTKPLTAKDIWRARELSLLDGRVDTRTITEKVKLVQKKARIAHLKVAADYSPAIDSLVSYIGRITPETHTIDDKKPFVALRKPKS